MAYHGMILPESGRQSVATAAVLGKHLKSGFQVPGRSNSCPQVANRYWIAYPSVALDPELQ
jgi:hypothetical protein